MKSWLFDIANRSQTRQDFWSTFIGEQRLEQMAEIGVYRGDFAAFLLQNAPSLVQYYMIDPWRHLEHWNKPANTDDATFNVHYKEMLEKTQFARRKRHILRGTTTEVIDTIPDASLDLVYIDGDHTLRGITIDLLRTYPKVKEGGWIGGDDFSPSIWQHPGCYEPTLVFPFALYFAEAVSSETVW